MKIIGLKKINNLNPKECCGMKKRYIKLSVIFLMVVIVFASVLSGVTTIVKAKSLIKYYDSVCKYGESNNMYSLNYYYLSEVESYNDDDTFIALSKWLAINRTESLKELRENGLMYYASICRNGEILFDARDNIPVECEIYNESEGKYVYYDRMLNLRKIMDDKTYDDFWGFFNEIINKGNNPVKAEIFGKFDERYFYPESLVFYLNNNVNEEKNDSVYVFEFPEYVIKTTYGDLKDIEQSNADKFQNRDYAFIDIIELLSVYEYNSLVSETPEDNINRYLTEDEESSYINRFCKKKINEYVNIMRGNITKVNIIEGYMFTKNDEYTISYYANPLKEAVKALKKEYKIIIAISVAAYLLIEVLIYRKIKKEIEYEETTKKVYGAIAHELKTPLGVMKMYNEMIDSGELDKETESEYRKIMDSQIDDMDKIIRTMIDCAKLEAGIVHLNIEEINFSELVNGIVSRQKYNLEKRKIKININSKDDIIVNGDLSGITYMVSNLLINAIKYTDAKEEISINVSEDDKWVMFIISNNVKPDMDSEMKQYKDGNIFRDVKKDGIGLLIVKGYAKLHKGEWGYENKEGNCKFYFKLRKEFNG